MPPLASEIYSDGTYLASNPDWHAADSAWKADQCRLVIDQLRLRPGSIADVGCGAGGVIAHVGRSFSDAELSGFDPSGAAIDMARRDHPEVEFHVGTVTGRHDLVLVMDVIEHVEDPFGFMRDLRPHAGVVLLHVPLELNAYYVWRDVLMENRRRLGHIHYFTKETALALVKDAGYDILAHRYTPSYVDHAGTDAKSRVITAVQRAAFRLAPDRATVLVGGYSLMVAARPAA
jgi:SAM-dependent methyltransferase